MSEKILVTGGAGYIGSHVVNLLGQQNEDIIVVDNLSTGIKKSILYGEFVQADCGDIEKMDELFRNNNFKSVLHFAGSIVVPESVEKPLEYYHNNTINTHRLLTLCEKYGVENFIFSSTASVYGITESGVCDESTAKDPINPYGKSKLMNEMMLEDLDKVSSMNYVVLRYFNVSGANIDGLIGQSTPQATHLIKVSCEVAIGKRNKMSIFGDDYATPDGTCIRDYIHIEDLAMAHIDSLNYLRKEKKSQTLNCGYGQGYSVKEVIDVVKKVSGVDFPVEIVPRRKGDPAKLISKAEKIKTVLGWQPKYNDIEIIIKTALDWEKKLLENNN